MATSRADSRSTDRTVSPEPGSHGIRTAEVSRARTSTSLLGTVLDSERRTTIEAEAEGLAGKVVSVEAQAAAPVAEVATSEGIASTAEKESITVSQGTPGSSAKAIATSEALVSPRPTPGDPRVPLGTSVRVINRAKAAGSRSPSN